MTMQRESCRPLTDVERRQLNAKLKQFPVSMVRDMQAGISVLPKTRQQRALLEWAQRTPVPNYLRELVKQT